jgi:hypothetical protein
MQQAKKKNTPKFIFKYSNGNATKSSYYQKLKADFFLKLITLKSYGCVKNKDNIKYH